MEAKVLLAGESWITTSTHLKGFDFFSSTQMQDANLAGGETPDIPQRWFDAMVAGMAHRLSRNYPPPGVDSIQFETLRKADAKEAWDIAAGQDSLMQFFQVSEGFEHQQIDATLDQSFDLLPKCCARFFERSLAEWLDAHAERTNRCRDPDIKTFSRFASYLRARKIDIANLIRQAVPG